MNRYTIITTFILFLLCQPGAMAQKGKIDPFGQLIDEVQSDVISSADAGFVIPNDEELYDFSKVLNYFRNGLIDSTRSLLRKYNYTLDRITDARTGATYDIIRERRPIHRGWGTYIFNERHTKQLAIHVPHPADDANALSVSADLFRRTSAAWLMIAGTGKKIALDKFSSDIARTRRSVFQRVHEVLTDPGFVSLSIHAYAKKYYQEPIASTDIVLSNGTTPDEQWGISQISIAYRDSLRLAGYTCAVAMYDSGYGALSANTNPQGTYSNENTGFGHWINVELSNALRENPAECAKFVQVTDRLFDFSGKNSALQMGKVFGLVSPRVVRIDSAHPIMFPAPGQQTYRIISFDPSRSRNDTLSVHVGSWLNLFNSSRSVARIQSLDSTGGVLHEFRRTTTKGSRNVVASIVERAPDVPFPADGSPAGANDSSQTGDEGVEGFEPIQVHRIPLQPMVLTTGINQGEIVTTSYRWNGILRSGFSTNVPVFHMTDGSAAISESDMMPSFLIPLMSNSYRNAESKFVGVQMTKVLVEEIARLVTDQDHQQRDVNLVAEENENGDYYLRIYPAPQEVELADMK